MVAAEEVGTPSAVEALGKVSAIIRGSDAEDLTEFFKNGGLAIFSGSPTAAIMAKLSMFGHTARPCLDCGGDLASWREGTGFQASKADPRKVSQKQRDLLALLDVFVPDDGLLPPAGDKLCPTCKGRGWALPKFRTHSHGPLTARPTGSSKHGKPGSSIDVNETSMALMGRVSSRLARVREAQGSTPAAEALEAWYSPSPDARTLGSLWCFTAVGKTMLRKNPRRLPPTQLWQNLRNEQAQKPTDGRAAQFKAADEQSGELYRAACILWNEVGR